MPPPVAGLSNENRTLVSVPVAETAFSEEPGPTIVGALGGFYLLGSALSLIVANVLINKQPAM